MTLDYECRVFIFVLGVVLLSVVILSVTVPVLWLGSCVYCVETFPVHNILINWWAGAGGGAWTMNIQFINLFKCHLTCWHLANCHGIVGCKLEALLINFILVQNAFFIQCRESWWSHIFWTKNIYPKDIRPTDIWSTQSVDYWPIDSGRWHADETSCRPNVCRSNVFGPNDVTPIKTDLKAMS